VKEDADPTSPHSALLRAAAAATAYDWLATAIMGRPAHSSAFRILPMVVIRGRLVVYDLAQDSRENLEEVGARTRLCSDGHRGQFHTAALD